MTIQKTKMLRSHIKRLDIWMTGHQGSGTKIRGGRGGHESQSMSFVGGISLWGTHLMIG